jgi:hypothetical protein
MSKVMKVALGLALLAMMFVLGCGEGDGSSGQEQGDATNVASSTGPPSKEEFIRQAEQICKKADDRVYVQADVYRETHAKELNELGPIPAEEKLLRMLRLPAIRKQIKGIEALGIPKGEEKAVKALFAAMAVGLKKAEKEPYELEGENPSNYPFERYSELAREFGFSECRNLG